MQLFLFSITIVPFWLFGQGSSMNSTNSGSSKNRVQFGGAFGLAISKEYTDITIAPSVIVNLNDYFAFGAGLQYSNLKQKNYYSSNLYGGSIIGLISPIEKIQFSAEVEQVYVTTSYLNPSSVNSISFWNTAVFVGVGYRAGNVTFGGRYNLLFDKNNDVYGEAFMPFVRVFF